MDVAGRETAENLEVKERKVKFQGFIDNNYYLSTRLDCWNLTITIKSHKEHIHWEREREFAKINDVRFTFWYMVALRAQVETHTSL